MANLLRNTLVNSAAFLINVISSLALLPLTYRCLGAERAGLWVLMNTLGSYFLLLDLGLSPALIKYTAEASEVQDWRRVTEVYRASMLCYGLLGVLAIAGMFLAGQFLHWLASGVVIQAEDRSAFRVIGIQLGLSFPMGVFGALLKGKQRYDWASGALIISIVVRFLGAVGLLYIGQGLLALAVMALASQVLLWAITWIGVRREFPDLGWGLLPVDWATVRAIVSFGGAVTLVQVSQQLTYPTVRLAVSTTLGPAALISFEAAFQIYRLTLEVPSLLASAVLPHVAGLWAKREIGRIQALFYSGTRLSLVLYTALAIPIVVFADRLLEFWMGEGFGSNAPLVWVLVTHLAANFNHIFGYYVLLGMGHLRQVVIYYIMTGFLTLLSVWGLVRWSGLLGAVLAVALPYVLLEPWMIRQLLRLLEVRFRFYVTNVMAPVLGGILLALTTALFLYSRSDNRNGVHILWQLGLGVLITLGVMFAVALKPEDRLLLRQGLR